MPPQLIIPISDPIPRFHVGQSVFVEVSSAGRSSFRPVKILDRRWDKDLDDWYYLVRGRRLRGLSYSDEQRRLLSIDGLSFGSTLQEYEVSEFWLKPHDMHGLAEAKDGLWDQENSEISMRVLGEPHVLKDHGLRVVYSQAPQQRFDHTVQVFWKLFDYLGENHESPNGLPWMVTVTADRKNAVAKSLFDHVMHVWGEYGLFLLSTLRISASLALDTRTEAGTFRYQGEAFHDSNLQSSFQVTYHVEKDNEQPSETPSYKEYAAISFSCPTEKVEQTIHQLAWMAASLRPNPIQTNVNISSVDIVPAPYGDRALPTKISLRPYHAATSPHLEGSWASTLFPTATIASPFPIARNKDDDLRDFKGVELSFEIIREIWEASWIILYKHGIIMLWGKLIFVPTKVKTASVQWELVVQDPTSRAPAEKELEWKWLLRPDRRMPQGIDEWALMRHFVV